MLTETEGPVYLQIQRPPGYGGRHVWWKGWKRGEKRCG